MEEGSGAGRYPLDRTFYSEPLNPFNGKSITTITSASHEVGCRGRLDAEGRLQARDRGRASRLLYWIIKRRDVCGI